MARRKLPGKFLPHSEGLAGKLAKCRDTSITAAAGQPPSGSSTRVQNEPRGLPGPPSLCKVSGNVTIFLSQCPVDWFGEQQGKMGLSATAWSFLEGKGTPRHKWA